MSTTSAARSFRGTLLGGAAWVALMVPQAHATTLTFEGLQNGEAIDNYYDSGFGGSGSGPGPNYGITFTPNSLARNINSPTPVPPGNTVAFFIGAGDYMNKAAGFGTSLSFYYYNPGTAPGTVTVYSGLNGTGNALLTLTLSPDFGFDAAGDFFPGTAESVDFSGSANNIYFDNVTFDINALVVPEPTTLTLLAAGLLGVTALFSQRWLARR